MTDEPLYPIESAEKVVSEFLDCSFPQEEWDHAMHLVVGFYMIATYKEEAYVQMKKHLLHYNSCYKNEGYHETMTQFWVYAIRKYGGNEKGELEWNQTTLDEVISDDDLTHRNLWNRFYSKELMLSDKARKEIVEPDISPFFLPFQKKMIIK